MFFDVTKFLEINQKQVVACFLNLIFNYNVNLSVLVKFFKNSNINTNFGSVSFEIKYTTFSFGSKILR